MTYEWYIVYVLYLNTYFFDSFYVIKEYFYLPWNIKVFVCVIFFVSSFSPLRYPISSLVYLYELVVVRPRTRFVLLVESSGDVINSIDTDCWVYPVTLFPYRSSSTNNFRIISLWNSSYNNSNLFLTPSTCMRGVYSLFSLRGVPLKI